jgi:hypothetical protein
MQPLATSGHEIQQKETQATNQHATKDASQVAPQVAHKVTNNDIPQHTAQKKQNWKQE